MRHSAASLADMEKFRQACILTAIFLPNFEAQEVWTHRYSPSQVEFGDGPVVAVGRPGLYLAGTGLYTTNEPTLRKFLRSTDGITWSTVDLPHARYMSVTATTFIGVSDKGIWTTATAQNFQQAYSAGNNFNPT